MFKNETKTEKIIVIALGLFVTTLVFLQLIAFIPGLEFFYDRIFDIMFSRAAN